jgi:FkbM family methyltransferase
MRHVENMINRHPRLIEVADFLLPELVKAVIRRVLLAEKYPLPDPVVVEINGVEAKFWIDNPSDWYRIARGGFEDGFAQELLSTIVPEDVFLDIGSAQGLYSITAATAGAEVYAVDPDPISVRSLKKNKAVNEGIEERLHILEVAVGDQPGTLEFNTDPRGIHAASLKRVNRELSQPVVVPVTTVDILIGQGMHVPTIVKIDVEGAEALVLKGMSELLTSSQRPSHLFVEFHEHFLPQFGSSLSEVQAYIARLGYIPANKMHNHRDKQLQHFVPGEQIK